MFKAIFTNSFGILFSRILGFIRDMLQASILGANIYTDIFIVAFKLPNLFRRIFAEGAFVQSFLPAFTQTRRKGLFSVAIFKRFALFLLILSLFVTLFPSLLTKLIATGFSEKSIELATPLVAINFYYLLLIFIVTFFASLLQYKNHFATTAFSTALLNIALISALLYSKDLDKYSMIYNLSIAVIIGGVMQVLVHLVAIKKYGLHRLLLASFKHKEKHPDDLKGDIKGFKSQFFASTLGSSTAQISAFLDGWLASFLFAGSISYLYYANRIFQFPLALFSIATSVAIFPKVARYLHQNNEQKALAMLHKSFWFLLSILLSATLIGIILSDEIVWLLYQRGNFSAQDSAQTARILSMYLIGLLPFGLSRIFSLWLYATKRQQEAAKNSAYSLGLNILLSLLLIYPLKASGLALASSLSGFLLFALTVRAFGTKAFLGIIRVQYIVALLIFTGVLSVALIYLKEFLHAYL